MNLSSSMKSTIGLPHENLSAWQVGSLTSSWRLCLYRLVLDFCHALPCIFLGLCWVWWSEFCHWFVDFELVTFICDRFIINFVYMVLVGCWVQSEILQICICILLTYWTFFMCVFLYYRTMTHMRRILVSLLLANLRPKSWGNYPGHLNLIFGWMCILEWR